MPAAAPIMLTATSHWRVGQRWQKWRDLAAIPPVRGVPAHVSEIAVDCGGFVAAVRHGGRYPFTFDAYVDWLYSVPSLSWAAMPDLPVERELAPTHDNLRRRQELTLEWARLLWGNDDTELARVPWAWVPTIQGRDLADYVWMAERLAPLLDEQRSAYDYNAYGVEDLDDDVRAWSTYGAEHVRVGIGSLCRRSSTAEIVAIVRALADRLPGVRFHLWGVKLGALPALAAAGLLERVVSTDSAAWNGRFGSDLEAPKASTLSQRDYCWRVAWPAYRAKLDAILLPPPPPRAIVRPLGQLPMFAAAA